MRKYLAALLATALALPPLSALADVKPPPSMLTNASNAQLPAARTNLGVPTNWLQQYHQNGGGTVNGHYLGWGDQNYDVLADHLGAQTQDASQATTATLGGTITAGDQIGWQIGSAHTYITVASGDTSTTLSNKLAAALQGGALSATIAGGAGGGYSNNDVVTLNGVSASCPTAPAFELTVAGGNVTAAAVTGSGGSGIIGGYCTATPTGPFAVTGGSGSGLTLNVSFAGPAIAQAMAAIHDANGFGYAATAHLQGSTLQFDFPYGATLLTCASGGTGSGCPGSPTETIAVTIGSLDNGPYGYLARLVPGRTPELNDAIAAWRGIGQSSATSGLDTQYGGLEVWIGAASSPEGMVSLEGSGNGNLAMSPLFSCQYSDGCWVENGSGGPPNPAIGAGPGGFGLTGLLVQSASASGHIGYIETSASNGDLVIGGASSQILVGTIGNQPYVQSSSTQPIAVQQNGGVPGTLSMSGLELLDSGNSIKASFGWTGSYTHLYDNIGGYDAVTLAPGGALTLMPGGQEPVAVGGTLTVGTSISTGGNIQTYGVGAGFQGLDRSSSGAFTIYRNAGTNYLYDQAGGNVLAWQAGVQVGAPAGSDEGSGTLNLAGALYNNGTAPTGTGAYVRATSPTLTTPVLGAATATTINGNTFTAGTYTVTGAAGKTLTFNNSLTFAGTDGATYTGPTTSKTLMASDFSNATASVASQSQPTNPTGTTSTTGIMMGLAGSITPTVSGKIMLVISGDIFNASAVADGAKVQASYGTGTAPSNGATITGTQCGARPQYVASTTAGKSPFSVNCVVTGLSLSTAYWLDLTLAAITGGTATINDVSISAYEIR